MKPTMCWFDIETTGLDANKDVPLEMGIVLTDDWGGEIASAKCLIMETNFVYEIGITRGKANNYVRNMHEESGLWDDLACYPKLTRNETELKMIQFLKDWGVEAGTLAMCGNSIGSLDRPCTLVHFPNLNEFLHYRNIDMSTIKEICRRVNPGLFENIKPFVENKEAATHRVLDDCRASIREYQVYLEEFLIVGDE